MWGVKVRLRGFLLTAHPFSIDGETRQTTGQGEGSPLHFRRSPRVFFRSKSVRQLAEDPLIRGQLK